MFLVLQEPGLITIRGEAQGTTYTIRFVPGKRSVEKKEVDSIFKVIDRSLSLYDPQSLINEFNRTGRILMDQHMKRVVETSIHVYHESGGAFDISSGLLSRTWGFGPGGKGQVPSKRDIRRALELTGTDKIEIRGDSLFALKKGVQIDCNGIAQGYSVDLITRFLSSRGLEHMLVEVGGEISVKGDHPETSDWKIGIESVEPVAGDWRPVDTVIMMKNKAVTTSGDYRKYFSRGNMSYSHVIDPKKGRPVKNGVISVTIIAGDAITADAWDNAFFVMGVDAVARYLQQRKDLSVFMIYRDKEGEIRQFVKSAE
jgi:thiamine biosynthesis lipoprotein